MKIRGEITPKTFHPLPQIPLQNRDLYPHQPFTVKFHTPVHPAKTPFRLFKAPALA